MNRFKFIITCCVFLFLLVSLIVPFKQKSSNQTAFTHDNPPSEAMKALQYLSMGRMYPDEAISKDGYSKAFAHAMAMPAASSYYQTRDEWECKGPENQGGRTIGLCVDPKNPNVVYAGSASGGLWRLTISGSSYSWEYIETGFPVLGVNSIAVDPNNSDIIYIGTGEMYGYSGSFGGLYTRSTRGSVGIGLLKSTDRGKTWKKSIDWQYQQHRGVQCVRLDPKDAKVVYAATSEGVYRSKDAGGNWEKVLDKIMAVDIVINPSNPQILYASCGNLSSRGHGIYRSKSGGDKGSWTKLSGGLPSSWGGKTLLSLCKSAPNTIYASVADAYSQKGLYKTTDGGDSWRNMNSQNVCSYQGFFAHYIRVAPDNPSEVLWAGVNIYTSTNSGTSVQSRSGMHVDHHCFADHPTNPDIVFCGNDGGVYRSTDGGRSYRGYNTGYVTCQFYNGFACSHQSGNLAIGGLQDNSCKVYKGSKNWSRALGGDGTFCAINTKDDDIMYGASQNLNISRTTNGGRNWSNISGSFSGRTCFIAPYMLAHSKPEVLYGGTQYVFKTTNGGTRWSRMNGGNQLNGNAILSIGVSPTNHNVVYAATAPYSGKRAELYASYDGGSSFKKVTRNLPDRYYLDIAISPHNDKVAYVTLLGFGTSHLYRTEDGGDTWDDIGKDLPDVPTSAVIVDPKDHNIIYVGNDFGVFISTDYGKNWQRFSEGLHSAVWVMDLVFSPSNNKIWIASHGNGAWERTMFSSSDIYDKQFASRKAANSLRNYPNPVKTATKIEFSLQKASPVSLQILNMKGQAVRKLVSKHYGAGTFSVPWDGCNSQGQRVAHGQYVCRLTTKNFTKTITMNVIP